jgi:hypothetical protein
MGVNRKTISSTTEDYKVAYNKHVRRWREGNLCSRTVWGSLKSNKCKLQCLQHTTPVETDPEVIMHMVESHFSNLGSTNEKTTQ